ncbi:Fur family transcriptional regulator, peroxide stress response regulator [Peptoclostridium litorale DSM 5388]|uniref:Ferric uptake regulator, Fur family n=1 Tax=Peptoclostridium litorale DSM 5388 TaxID=1121324 RepID=A0A069RKG2_PEPLI|nr:Fur family transcriptional regulator [Peptoclostridium litorale]KDR94707.1 ferric uptake regulator, Fur family [Peptoclostridium litorale DSM 5388]SIO32901.1 Fur family transcriptional regulator, peroxide stress response regulator [Peptoclostridium litorale DSM 5388]
MRKQMNIDGIGEYLKEHGIKPSYQRIRIFEYLMEKRNHPTVDLIYRALLPEIPTLSKTTVYNTLNLFIEKGITLLIVIEENETRYDADISDHGHFKCEKCGNVYDFDFDISRMDINGLEGFGIKERHVYFKGICSECM